MRCATGLITVVALSAAVGCRNQSAPLTNPFVLQPDRVPPPSTRALPPGTAQPIYYGNSAPPAAAGVYPPASALAPVPGAAAPVPGTLPSTYPGAAPAPTYSPAPVTPTTPPAAWPAYPASAQAPAASGSATALAGGESVSVPSDSQRLRFEAPTLAATAPATASAAGGIVPNRGLQNPVQQASYNEPVAAATTQFERLQSRAVTPAEFAAAPAATRSASSAATAAADGFRPQGSEPRPAVADGSSVGGFRSPSLGRGNAAGQDETAPYAVGPNQQWLRGQLEYWPESGEWSIRYMPDGQVDQIGGRILIDNPQVLANLSPGELVRVEGQVFGRQLDEDYYRPAYRVAVVQRQRQ